MRLDIGYFSPTGLSMACHAGKAIVSSAGWLACIPDESFVKVGS